MANDKISNMTAAVVGDLGATTSGFEVSADLGGTPDTLRLTLGTLADWLEASQLAALIVTHSVASAPAIAPPGAFVATRGAFFASTVSGGVLMGFGTTNDVALMNRAGTVCLGVGPNTAAINIPGTLAVTGFTTIGSSTGAVEARLTFDSLANYYRDIVFRTGASARWLVGANDSGESGGNAGSNFEFLCYSDSAVYIGTAIAITRATLAVTLGGTLTVTGAVAIGTTADTSKALYILGAVTSTGTSQQSLMADGTFSSAATAAGYAGFFRVRTAAAAFTMSQASALYLDDAIIGATSAITTLYGLQIASITTGGTNYAIYTNAGLVRFGDAATFASTVAVTGATTATGGLLLATQPTIYPAAGGMWQLATAGTDPACTDGTSYFVELNLPYIQTLTGLAYQVGSTGGTDSVIVTLYNSAGTVVANSALAGATVGTAAQIQSVAFTGTYAAVAGRYFASVTFNGATAKFRTYPIPGSKFIAGSEAETFGTVTAITPGTSFTADKGPLCYVY